MIDDLCDSGLTLLSVRDKLLEAGAASVKSVVLLDKRARRKVCSAGLVWCNWGCAVRVAGIRWCTACITYSTAAAAAAMPNIKQGYCNTYLPQSSGQVMGT